MQVASILCLFSASHADARNFQGVADFTSVLRPGFRLSFQATMNEATNELIGSYVAPTNDVWRRAAAAASVCVLKAGRRRARF